jgi:hypothetical protein
MTLFNMLTALLLIGDKVAQRGKGLNKLEDKKGGKNCKVLHTFHTQEIANRIKKLK